MFLAGWLVVYFSPETVRPFVVAVNFAVFFFASSFIPLYSQCANEDALGTRDWANAKKKKKTKCANGRRMNKTQVNN